MFFLLALAAAAAQPACGEIDADVPAPFVTWMARGPTVGALGAPFPATMTLNLQTTETTSPTGRPIDPKRYEGELPLEIETAGTYEIALSDAAWIDVLRGDTVLQSSSHRHGPPCTTIRKIVAFQLTPGTYRLKLTNSPATATTVLIVNPANPPQLVDEF